MSKKLFLLLILTLGLRLISLNQSLWLDEAISANVATNFSYSQIVKTYSPSDFHPPLYYFVLKLWISVFGNSEISLRLPSVLFSLITVILIYRNFSFWPALLLSLNPLYLYYSQEARMYSLITLLVFSAFIALKNKKYFFYFIFTFLSLSTFYGSVFFFIAVSLYFLFKKQYRQFILYSLPPIFSLLVLSPLLLKQYQNSQSLLVSVTNWSAVLGTANLKNILLIPIKFTLGRISFYPKIVYYLIAFVFTLPLFSLVLKNSFQKRFPAFLFWSTLLIGFAFSLFTPMFQYFRFLYLLPLFCLLINKNLFYIFIFAIFSLIYLFNPNFHREDWKTLSQNLPSTVYMISSASDPVKYYRPDITIGDLSSSISSSDITIIPYITQIHGLDYQNHLVNLGYTKKEIKNFRQLTTETWVKAPVAF